MKEEIKITPVLLAKLKNKAISVIKDGPCGAYWKYEDTVAGYDDGLADQLCYYEDDSDGGFYVPIENLELVDGVLAKYIAAANPAVILALIDRIEKDRELIEFLRISNEIDEIMGRANYAFLDRLQAILEIKPDTQNLTRKIDDIYADILNAVKSLKHK